MPRLEGMHAPGSDCVHLLPRAGYTLPFESDVFRFNRTLPFYPPDPNIRPNEGDLACPIEWPNKYEPPVLPAGIDVRWPSDVYRFYKVREDDSCNPCKAQAMIRPCHSAYLQKPRYPPSKPGRHFDYRYPSGATECKQSTHRHGHVPESCNATYLGADEILRREQPRLSDCETCQYGKCTCGGQTRHSTRGNTHIYRSSIPSYGGSMKMSNEPRIHNASMYNNTSGGYSSNASSIGDCHGNSARFMTPKGNIIAHGNTCPQCDNSYFQTNYVCRPMLDRSYRLDCLDQDGPPAGTYTFL